jgi:D-tyrosyl-tRNA(Tyr) deacylase
MIAVVQRVTSAQVSVDGEAVGKIGAGLVVLVAITRSDGESDVNWMARKLVGLRIFRNGDKHFDSSIEQTSGSLLVISNFTVAAATRQGRRPGFDAAADPQTGKKWFNELIVALRATGLRVETGQFGADMQVELINDGPATVLLDSGQMFNP